MTGIEYINRKDDHRYAFAVGKVRALEAQLLDTIFFRRLIEVKNVEEMYHILGETSYGDHLQGGASRANLESILLAELDRTYSLMKSMDPASDSLINLLSLRYDFHNLKVLLKSNQLGAEADYLLTPLGGYGPQVIRQMVNSGDYNQFPPRLAKDIGSLIVELERSSHPSYMIDISLDRHLYQYLLHETKRRQVGFLTTLFRFQIDLNNIRTFLRVKQMEKERGFLDAVLLDGGQISRPTLLSLLAEPLSQLLLKLNFTPYAQVAKEGIEYYQRENSLALFEKLMDNFFIHYIGTARYITLGVEPLISFIIAKENEVKNLRIVIIGKQNRLPHETIEERLRDIYG